MLQKLSVAAGVPFAWLGTGQGGIDGELPAQATSILVSSEADAIVKDFRERLAKILKARNAADRPVEPSEVAVLANSNAAEIVVLCRMAARGALPVKYLLSGNPELSKIPRTLNQKGLKKLNDAIALQDHLWDAAKLSGLSAYTPIEWNETIFDLFTALYSRLKPSTYRCHVIDDRMMEPTLRQGDTVLVNHTDTVIETGLYLFASSIVKGHVMKYTVARATAFGENSRISYDNPDFKDHTVDLETGELACKGKVELILRWA
jgi:hypothetical protein